MKKLLILGAGGYGKTICDLARQTGDYEKIAFLDDSRIDPSVLGVCGDYPMFADENTEMYPAFGNNESRMHWLELLEDEGIPVASLVHPKAYVSPTAHIGTGSVVLPMAVVNTDVWIGSGCIINIGALVDHDCVISDGVHLAPGAIVKAGNRIPAGMKVESGCVIGNREYPL